MTEHKFKVGDTVRCPSAGVRGAGDFIGRVENRAGRIYRLTGYPLGIHEDDLELVEDADGWRPWSGGDNLAPGCMVQYKLGNGPSSDLIYGNEDFPSHGLLWRRELSGLDITAYRIVQDAEGWNIWRGGECPCDPDRVIEVRLRDGGSTWGMAGGAGWTHRNSPNDIVAWRPAKETGVAALAENMAARRQQVDEMEVTRKVPYWHWTPEDPTTAPKLRLTPEQPAPIDPATIKPGDRVAVWCEVSKTGDGRLWVVTHKPDSRGVGDTTFTVWDKAFIALHEPKPEEPIKVGDIVQECFGGTHREVLAIWNSYAWTRSVREQGGDDFQEFHLEALTRI